MSPLLQTLFHSFLQFFFQYRLLSKPKKQPRIILVNGKLPCCNQELDPVYKPTLTLPSTPNGNYGIRDQSENHMKHFLSLQSNSGSHTDFFPLKGFLPLNIHILGKVIFNWTIRLRIGCPLWQSAWSTLMSYSIWHVYLDLSWGQMKKRHKCSQVSLQASFSCYLSVYIVLLFVLSVLQQIC